MSDLIPVSEALEALFALARPTEVETVPLTAAAGRVLAETLRAGHDQPPFAASSMDGYALRAAEAGPGQRFTVIGEAAAGHGFPGTVGPGETVRIFTGAPLPAGADKVVIQEDVTREGATITLGARHDASDNIRPPGNDFKAGAAIEAPRRLRPQDLALLAAMNHATVPVHRRPTVALIATGDELVMPGETPRPDQIIASNAFGLKAAFEAEGATVRLLPIAPDRTEALAALLDLARGADLVVTIGGASVGDHDLVAAVAADLGLARSFYKVAMRPGKPLMSGRLGGSVLIGLPGNPVSAMVCGHVFVIPVLRAMQGLPARPRRRHAGVLAHDIGANGPREHYMRARFVPHAGATAVAPEGRQDSSLLSVLAVADCLMVRAPKDPAQAAGSAVEYLPL